MTRATGVVSWFRGLRERTFVGHVAVTSAARGIALVLGLITSIVVSRKLGPSGRGTLAVATTFAALLAQFGNLGIHASNTYEMGGRDERLPPLLANSLVAATAAGGVSAIVMFVGRHVAPDAFRLSLGLTALVVFSVPVSLALLFVQNLLLALRHVGPFNAIEVAQRAVTAVLVVALVAMLTPSLAFALTVGAQVVVLAYGLVTLARSHPVSFRPSWQQFHDSFAYGMKAFSTALGAYFVLRVDLLLVDRYLGSAETGIYSISAAMVEYFLVVPQVIGSLLFPRLAVMGKPEAQRSAAIRVLKVSAIVMLMLVALSSLAAGPAIRLLYGAAYSGAVTPFLWLLPGAFAISLAIVYNNYFASVGIPRIVVIAPIVSAVINVIMNVYLIPRYRLAGAAIASSVCYTLWLAVLLGEFLRRGTRSSDAAIANAR